MGRNSVSFSESSLEILVHVFQAGGVFELGLLLGDCLFLALEQFLGRLAPRAEVVFVEDDQVPLHLVQPFVLGLDVPRVVAAQQVLEGTEIDEWLLGGDLRRIVVGIAGEVLPAIEVHVGFKVRLPRILHGWLEGHNEHSLGPEFPGELIGGEGFAESHLRVPQETRDGVHVLLPDGVEVGVRFIHGSGLLARIAKRLMVRAGELLPSAQLGEDGLHVLNCAAHPLQFAFSNRFLTRAARTS